MSTTTNQNHCHQPAVTMMRSSSVPQGITGPAFGIDNRAAAACTEDIWVSPFPYSAVRPIAVTNSALFEPGNELKAASLAIFMTTDRLYKPTADLDEAQPLLPLQHSEVSEHNYTCVSLPLSCPLKVCVNLYKEVIKVAKQRGNVTVAEQLRDILAKARDVEHNVAINSTVVQTKWPQMNKKKRKAVKLNRKTMGATWNDLTTEHRPICTSGEEFTEIEHYFSEGYARHGLMHKQESHLNFIRRMMESRNILCSCKVYYDNQRNEQDRAARERERKEKEKKTKKKPEPEFVEINEGYRHMQNIMMSGRVLQYAKEQAAVCAKSANMTNMLAEMTMNEGEHSGYIADTTVPTPLKGLCVDDFERDDMEWLLLREPTVEPNLEVSVTTEYIRGRIPKRAEKAAAAFARHLLADFVAPFREQAPDTYPPTMSDNQIMEKILRASGSICVDWDTEPLENGFSSTLFRPPLGPSGCPMGLMVETREYYQAGRPPMSMRQMDQMMERYKMKEEDKAWTAVIAKEKRENYKENEEAMTKANERKEVKEQEKEAAAAASAESDTNPQKPPPASKKATKPTPSLKKSSKSRATRKPVEFVVPEGLQKCYGEDGFVFLLPNQVAANFAYYNKDLNFTFRNDNDVKDFFLACRRTAHQRVQSTTGTSSDSEEGNNVNGNMNVAKSSRKRLLEAVNG